MTEDGARRPYFPRRNEWTTEYLKFSAPMPGPELDADGKRMFMSVAEKEPITSSAIILFAALIAAGNDEVSVISSACCTSFMTSLSDRAMS